MGAFGAKGTNVSAQLVTDEELAQARQNPTFRRQLIANNLDYLLIALAQLRASDHAGEPVSAEQLREGAKLAVQLADILQRAGGSAPPTAPDGPAL